MSAISRRELLKGAATAGAAALSWRLYGPNADVANASSPLYRDAVPTSRTLFGAYAGTVGNQDLWAALLEFEALLNDGSGKREVKVYRFYRKWQDPIDCALTRRLVDRGTRVYVSVHAWRGVNPRRPIKWRDIANGTEDAEIVRMANECKALKHRLYFCFHHEPEDDTNLCGTADDFVAAYEHLMDVFAANDVHNVTYVVTLMAATYNGTYGGGPGHWMPVRRPYQVGVDGYNRGKCFGQGSWIPFTTAFKKSHDFAGAAGRRLFIAECGCVEGGSCGGGFGANAKAAWFGDALSVLKGWDDVEAFCYSHTNLIFPFRIDTSTPSLTAFRAFASDPYFRH